MRGWAGKWAARADDVLSWLPARITPMATMGLALKVRLHKPGVYLLNATGSAPQPLDTQRAVRYASNALVAIVLLGQAAMGCIAFVRIS